MMAYHEYTSSMDYCHACYSTSLHTDVSAGDIICTSCGLVLDQHILHRGPEWRDYDNVDDLAKGLPSLARSGLTPVDEMRYIGGLEPTMLGNVFGGCYGHGSSDNSSRERRIRSNLIKMDKITNKLVEKEFSKKIQESKLAIKSRQKNRQNNGIETSSSYEHDQLVQKEIEELQKSQIALLSEKWSLDRALLLYGADDEIPSQYTTSNPVTGRMPVDVESERETLYKKLDSSQRNASLDVYHATRLLLNAMRRLNLANNTILLHEATENLLKYATLREGFHVNGISSRVNLSSQHDQNISDATSMKQNVQYQKDKNKIRQMAALSSTFIFLACKKHGFGRTLVDICSSFQWDTNTLNDNHDTEDLIKPKHSSKALKEVKNLLPEYIKSVTAASMEPSQQPYLNNVDTILPSSCLSSDQTIPDSNTNSVTKTISNLTPKAHHEIMSTTSLIQHTLQKLNLSPPALVAICKLVLYCKEEQMSLGTCSGTKPITLIASITYLVCNAGAVMQKLAFQAINSHNGVKKEQTYTDDTKYDSIKEVNYSDSGITNNSSNSVKRKNNQSERLDSKRSKVSPATISTSSSSNRNINSCHSNHSVSGSNDTLINFKNFDSEFDIQNQTPVKIEYQPENVSDQKHTNSIMQSWQEWSHEKPWIRSWKEIESSSHISLQRVRDYYSKELFPRRRALLEVLQTSFQIDNVQVDSASNNVRTIISHVDRHESNTFEKTHLLTYNISAVASLMSSKSS